MSRLLALIPAGALAAVAVLHARWARRDWWPAAGERELALAVVGSARMPSAGACAVVAAATGTMAACLVTGGSNPAIVAARGLVGAGLIGRGLAGGVFAARRLGLPEPGAVFRALDDQYYRPACVGLGALAIATAKRDRR